MTFLQDTQKNNNHNQQHTAKKTQYTTHYFFDLFLCKKNKMNNNMLENLPERYTMICKDMSVSIFTKFLLVIPYFETFLGSKIGTKSGEIIVDYNWSNFEAVLKYSNYGNTDNLSQTDVDAIGYYIMIDVSGDLKETIKCLEISGRLYKIKGILHKLESHQPEHIMNFLKLFDTYTCGMDYSETGAGKTFTTCAIAYMLSLSIFVICDKSVISTWIEVAEYYGVKIVHIQTFQGFSNKNTKHGYLKYNKDTQRFSGTQQLDTLLISGILIVIDECDKCKNKTATTDSIVTLSNRVHVMNKYIEEQGWSRKSKVIAISAYPFEDEKHVMNISRILGFTKDEKDWYYKDKTVTPPKISRGFMKLCEFPEFKDSVNPHVYNMVKRGKYFHMYQMKTYVYDFFNVIKPKIFCSMPPRESKTTVSNIFLDATEEEEQKALEGYQIMQDAVNNLNDDLQNKIDIAGFMRGIIIVQRVKAYPILREALVRLSSDNKCKVILFLPNLDMIAALYVEFMKCGYMPLRMTGGDSIKTRKCVIDLFGEDNGDYRIFLTNTQVSSKGINLDDKYGDRKRIVYITPQYRFLNILQAFGRVDRCNTKSNSDIYMVYLNAIRGELDMLNALNRKNQVVESVIDRSTPYTEII